MAAKPEVLYSPLTGYLTLTVNDTHHFHHMEIYIDVEKYISREVPKEFPIYDEEKENFLTQNLGRKNVYPVFYREAV